MTRSVSAPTADQAVQYRGVRARFRAPRRRGDRPRTPRWQRREQIVALAAVLPAVIVVFAFMLYPIGYAVWLSFNKSDGFVSTFTGLSNYTDILTSSLVHQVFLVNLKFLVSVPLVIFVASVCAVLLYEEYFGWRFFRVVFFIPSVLSTAVIGLMFKSTFAYHGPVNSILEAAGVAPIDFFARATPAMFVIILALVWSGFGYQMLILLSGLSAIDPEIFSAARVDGAGWWQRFWYITMPNIRRQLAFVCIINVLYTFTSLFGFIFVMTAGGPGYTTTTLDYLIYQEAFSNADIGRGAALAILVFLLIGVMTVVQLKMFRASEEN
ncbi:MAG: sugar ABC transporter permease [Actinocatenispora sp.]